MRFFDEPLSVGDYRVLISSDEYSEYIEFFQQLKGRSIQSGHSLGTKINTYIR